MNKWMAAAMAAMAMASAPAAGAATQSATMEVTFRIQDACSIRSGSAAPGQDAQVSCQYRTPYRIVPNNGAAASSSPTSPAPRSTEKPADTDAPAALTVFF